MIVIEGCDGTGKSTLATQLANDLNLKFGTRGTENRDDLYKVTRQDTYKALAHAVEGYHPPYIWDRLGFISDPIYCLHTQRDGGCAFRVNELVWLVKMVRAIGCPVIVCIVPYDLALENAHKDTQMAGVLGKFEDIYRAYNRYLTVNRSWVMPYDYTIHPYEMVREHIERYIYRRKEREWH